jgi:hypothetical protein
MDGDSDVVDNCAVKMRTNTTAVDADDARVDDGGGIVQKMLPRVGAVDKKMIVQAALAVDLFGCLGAHTTSFFFFDSSFFGDANRFDFFFGT